MFAIIRFSRAKESRGQFMVIRALFPTIESANVSIDNLTDNGLYCIIDLRCVKVSLVKLGTIKEDSDWDKVVDAVIEHWEAENNRKLLGVPNFINAGYIIRRKGPEKRSEMFGEFCTDAFARLRLIQRVPNMSFHVCGICVWSTAWPDIDF